MPKKCEYRLIVCQGIIGHGTYNGVPSNNTVVVREQDGSLWLEISEEEARRLGCPCEPVGGHDLTSIKHNDAELVNGPSAEQLRSDLLGLGVGREASREEQLYDSLARMWSWQAEIGEEVPDDLADEVKALLGRHMHDAVMKSGIGESYETIKARADALAGWDDPSEPTTAPCPCTVCSLIRADRASLITKDAAAFREVRAAREQVLAAPDNRLHVPLTTTRFIGENYVAAVCELCQKHIVGADVAYTSAFENRDPEVVCAACHQRRCEDCKDPILLARWLSNGELEMPPANSDEKPAATPIFPGLMFTWNEVPADQVLTVALEPRNGQAWHDAAGNEVSVVYQNPDGTCGCPPELVLREGCRCGGK
jgi:hypothetical protein